MSNERGKLNTPFASPDSIRATLQFMKKHFNGYTKRNYGYTDIRGAEYAGTVENFGSEIYTEARRMKLDKPPIESVIKRNNMSFYFDLLYSDLIDTYDQQNTLVSVLKENALLSGNEYRIIFRNCIDRYVLRSESWSDPDVYRDRFITTSTPPVLEVTEYDSNNNQTVTEITLDIIPEDSSASVEYSFNYNNASSHFIDSYDDGVLTTKTISNRDKNIPFIWIVLSNLKTLPNIGFINNLDQNNNPLLTVGTDGHSNSFLYPLIYSNNYPPFDPEDGLQWFLKIHSTLYDAFTAEGNMEHNYEVKIESVSFVRSSAPWIQPTTEVVVRHNGSYVSWFLDRDIDVNYHKPVPGDYDYDGTLYQNFAYAYIPLDEFNQNNPDISPMHNLLKPLLRVSFDQKFLNAYEQSMLNGVSGMHIDVMSDYCDNGIIEKNGITHGMCEFDGLPSYLTMLDDKTQHRSSVDMYSIRDRLNDDNQKVTDKQTAGIILDSALSQKDVDDLDLNLTIRYDYERRRRYYTRGTSISPKNWLSSIVYIGHNHFGDSDVKANEGYPKFIYHGNRSFSCSIVNMDPELEYGRGFLISNDPAEYNNNANSTNEFKRAPRAVAMMCDIPTVFSNLEHQTGISPTIIIDDKYVHMDDSYTIEDKDRLWNGVQSKWVTTDHSEANIGIFNNCDLDDVLSSALTSSGEYTEKINLVGYIGDGDYSIGISNGGSGYDVNDRFSFHIGGILVNGVVTAVGVDDASSVSLDIASSQRINIANLDDRITYFETETMSGSGTGLILSLTVDPVKWEDIQFKHSSTPYSNLFTFMLDENGFMGIWRYDHTWRKASQITGPIYGSNPYDDSNVINKNKRDTGSVMLYNMLNVSDWMKYEDATEYQRVIQPTDVSVDIPIESVSTFNEPCFQNSTYVLLNQTGGETHYKANVTSQNFDEAVIVDEQPRYCLLPRFNEVNLFSYRQCISSLIRFKDDLEQPILGFYNPIKDTISDLEFVSANMVVETSRPITWLDRIDNRFIDIYGITSNPLYVYDESNKSPAYQSFEEELDDKGLNALTNYVRNNYPDSYVLTLIDTPYGYSEAEMRDYIMSNFIDDPIYIRNNIHKVRNAGDQVVTKSGSSWIPEGEQPKGDYEYLIEKGKETIIINDVYKNANIEIVLSLENRVIDLDNFRVYNDYNEDISSRAMILMDHRLYIFDSKDESWMIIS